MEHYADIITSRAWRDDDDGTWNTEHLWINSDGTYSTCDEDGNHEPFPFNEGDSVEAYITDAERSWETYAEDVAETGEDPLRNYLVPRTTERTEKWTLWITSWIGYEQHGFAVTSARRGSADIIPPAQFPTKLAEYLFLTKVGDRYCMEGVTMEHIRSDADVSVKGKGPQYRVSFTLRYQKDRSENVVKRELKAIAKKHLAGIKERYSGKP